MKEPLLKYFDWQKGERVWLEEYSGFDISAWEKMLRTKGEDFWQRAGEQRALQLFHAAAKRIPAYKDFLRREKIDPKLIRTAKDFAQVPPTDKKNYTERYDLASRSWSGSLAQSRLIAVSSGTTGAPKYWPRASYQEFEAAIIHEFLYRYILDADSRRTLVVIGFPMGVYVSGVATLLPSWLAAHKIGLTIMSVGTNRTELVRVIENLHSNFRKVILIGHPFFIKDVITTGREAGISWDKIQPRMMFSSEGFNEAWRMYLGNLAGKIDPANMINTYGTSEMLLVAHETPLSIRLRNIVTADKKISKQIFGTQFPPSLFQYNPFLRYLENLGEEILFTVPSGIPLIRYNLHDSGSLLPFHKIAKSALYPEISRSAGRSWRLPFLALRGRSDHTVILYAANIYPEHIHAALQTKKFMPYLTGKFALAKSYSSDMDEFLNIHLELREGVRASRSLSMQAEEHIIRTLKKVNMEYLFISNNLNKDVRPKVCLWANGDPNYFRPGLKPKYIIES